MHREIQAALNTLSETLVTPCTISCPTSPVAVPQKQTCVFTLSVAGMAYNELPSFLFSSEKITVLVVSTIEPLFSAKHCNLVTENNHSGPCLLRTRNNGIYTRAAPRQLSCGVGGKVWVAR